MSDLKPNAELAYKVLDQIDAHPEQWDQTDWATSTECKTAYCFAGWAVVFSGREVMWVEGEGLKFGDHVADDRADSGAQWLADAAREALGVMHTEELFWGGADREDLGRLVEEIFGPRPAVTA